MADPKLNVQEAITNLEKLLNIIERDIKRYQEVDFEANTLGDDESKQVQDKAKKSLIKQVANIDKLILDNPEIKELIGSLDENADVKKLNDTILAIVSKVADVRALGMKDDADKDISFDVGTEGVVTEISKFKDRDYVDSEKIEEKEAIDRKIESLKKMVGEDGIYEKYEDASAKLKGKTVSDDYDEFTAGLLEKLDEYGQYEKAEGIDTAALRRIKSSKNKYFLISNKDNQKEFKQLLDVLKATNGDLQVTIGGKKVAIKDLKLEQLTTVSVDFKEVQQAVIDMCDKLDENKGKTEEIAADMKKMLEENVAMELFSDDKRRLEEALAKKPLDIKEVESIYEELTSSKGKNLALLEKLEKMDPAKVSRAREEIKRLEALSSKLKAEQEAQAQVKGDEDLEDEIDAKIEEKLNDAKLDENIKAEEIQHHVEFFGKKVNIRVDDSTRFVDKSDEEIEKMAREKAASYYFDDSVRRKIAEEYSDIMPIQIPIFSKLVSFLRGDGGITKRDKFIMQKIEEAIKADVGGRIQGARADAEKMKAEERGAIIGSVENEMYSRQEQAKARLETASTERKDAFSLDEETRKRVNAAAYEAARKAALEGKKSSEVEQAFNDAGKKAETDEGR